MIFKAWGKSRTSRKPFRVTPSSKDRAVLASINAKLRQVALDRLAILREYHSRLLRQEKPKIKKEIMNRFLAELNSGILSPNGAKNRIQKLSRSTLYNWSRAYKNSRLVGLVPRYRMKSSREKAIYQPLTRPIEMKFPGRPRARGKKKFIARIKRRWKNPPLECPIRLSIFFCMPIPKGSKMATRMRMLRHQISHKNRPHLDNLSAFVVSALIEAGVFRDPGQIISFHSEKYYAWWGEIRVLMGKLNKYLVSNG